MTRARNIDEDTCWPTPRTHCYTPSSDDTCEMYICRGTGELSAKIFPGGNKTHCIPAHPVMCAGGNPSICRDGKSFEISVDGHYPHIPFTHMHFTQDAANALQPFLDSIGYEAPAAAISFSARHTKTALADMVLTRTATPSSQRVPGRRQDSPSSGTYTAL